MTLIFISFLSFQMPTFSLSVVLCALTKQLELQNKFYNLLKMTGNTNSITGLLNGSILLMAVCRKQNEDKLMIVQYMVRSYKTETILPFDLGPNHL